MIAAMRVGWTRWNLWRAQSINRRIFSATLTVASVTVLVKATGAFKLVAVAHVFGTSDSLDAFLIAFLLPTFIAEVIGASVNSALIPTYIEVREAHGRTAAQELFSGVVALSALLLCSAGALMLMAHRALLRLIGSGFDAGKLALADSLFVIMLPLAVLIGINSIWRAVLNACGRFALAAAVPGITPIVTILLLIGGARTWGVYALAIGAVAGTAVEMFLVGRGLLQQGMRLQPAWPQMNPAMKQVIHQFAPMLTGAVLAGGSLLIDAAMAATLGSGSVAALSYGQKLTLVIVAIGPMALSTAALPHFSLMTAMGDSAGVRNTIRAGWKLILAATVPLTLLLVYFSGPLVRVLFQKGAFTEADTQLVAAVQSCALLQIPFAMLSAFLARLVSSLKANRILMWGAMINLTLTGVLDYSLMQWRGVPGIALAAALVSMIGCCYLWLAVRSITSSTSARYRSTV
jgi:putative peptidoglycan lipid II flippase